MNKQQNTFLHIYEKYKDVFFISIILHLCSFFYFFAYKLRLFLYKIKILKSHTLPAYVVSIGNITTGGTGKTPLAIECAKHFLSLNYKVAILLRGYMGSVNQGNNIVLVSDGKEILSDYEVCGEEAILIAKKVPKAIVMAGRDRAGAGKSAIKLGAEVLILDDGFQHLKIKRNKNVLILDAYNPFDSGYLLPKGKLRELPDSIKRADIILISNSDRKKIGLKEQESINKHTLGKPVYQLQSTLTGLTSLNTKQKISMDEAKKVKYIVFCGIGNPDSFIDLLKRYEIDIKEKIIFQDHHLYSYSDIENILKIAKTNNIENIITTEKDAVKIEELCQAAPATFWACDLQISSNTVGLFEKIFNDDRT